MTATTIFSHIIAWPLLAAIIVGLVGGCAVLGRRDDYAKDAQG